MKVVTIKLKKGSSELTSECRELIEQLSKCRTRAELLQFLETIHVWIYGKCELYHWIEILDRFDKILEEAARNVQTNEFVLHCDTKFAKEDVRLLLLVLNFTTLLIEHSFSRHLYNSIEHLTQLLSSQNMDIVLAVLNLLYMFSKRSNFIPRLPFEKKELLIIKLFNIAERWGDPNYGLSLKDCCIGNPKLEFLYQLCIDYIDETGHAAQLEIPDMMVICRTAQAAEVVKTIADQISKPSEAIKMRIAHRVRLISGFNNYKLRLQFVQARLQAVSILIYSNALQDNTEKVLYPGFGEELCELIDKEEVHLVEIRAAVLRTLTSMLHFDRNPNVPRAGSRLIKIVHYTGAERQGGILPLLVRDCIDNLTVNGLSEKYPLILATSLFSLLYHLASYEHGAHALVKSGTMQSLLRVISWPGVDLEHITFVTRAVRVIDLITNIDIAKFHQNNGLNVFIDRLEKEINSCSKALAKIGYNLKETNNMVEETLVDKNESTSDGTEDESSSATGIQIMSDIRFSMRLHNNSEETSGQRPPDLYRLLLDLGRSNGNGSSSGNVDVGGSTSSSGVACTSSSTAVVQYPPNSYYARPFSERKTEMSSANNLQPKKPSCVTQRAALLKSMLNFLKKSIQDHAHFSNMRNIMETSLTQSLRHIIANAEYYGPSLFLLATDVVTVYVFNEPSLLSSLQDLGITSVMLKALLLKDVPATREVLGSIPNVFSALCLNERGLMEFMSYDPFNKMLKVLLSPEYLVAMRRRRSSDPLGDTATNLGNAMDDLMKHHPYLRVDATEAIVRLLNELVRLGSDPSFICWRANKDTTTAATTLLSNTNNQTLGGANRNLNSQTINNSAVVIGDTATGTENDDSSGEDDDDDDEMSSASQQQQQQRQNRSPPANQQLQAAAANSSQPEREAIPLIDYILNVMKFIEAIFSNGSNGDHCREFVVHGGLTPILQLLSLPNLPVDSPVSTTAQAVANVCKSILNLAQETQVICNALQQLSQIVQKLKPLIKQFSFPGGSVLLSELITCPKLEDGFSNAEYTPILHNMSYVHGYVVMLVHLCRNASNDMRSILLKRWGADTETGVQLLQNLVQLYISLVWESTILLNLCSDEPSQHPDLLWDEVYASIAAQGTFKPASTSGDTEPMNISEEEIARKVERCNEFKYKLTPEEQFRYIKSLLAASSRLGRALAELLGTLVKLSVGTPQSRQRRNNDFLSNLNKVPTPEAREIARILSSILVNGFNHESILPKPAPKLKLTFLICSVGFTGPMLFDDKRSSFHLMISQFCAENGLKAFFDMFYWALSLDNKTPKFEFEQFVDPMNILDDLDGDTYDYPDGTGEFLDAWLQLLEKMVNPRAILESPYTMYARSSTLPDSSFEPIFYLAQIHQLAIQALRRIWKRKPIHNYGITMTETMMCILKHLIKSHAMITERYNARVKEIQNTKFVMDQLKSVSFRRASDDGVNAEHVKTLSDMGFRHFHIVEALRITPSLEDATEYLLSNPEASALSSLSSRENLSTGDDAASSSQQTHSNNDMEVDVDLAVSLSLRNSRSGFNSMEKDPLSDKFEIDYKDLKLIPDNTFCSFCQETLSRTFAFIEYLPETTVTGSELIAVLYRRNPPENQVDFLLNFVKNVVQWIEFALRAFDAPLSTRQNQLDEITWGPTATKLYVRLKVASLLLDDMYSDIRKLFCDAINALDALKPLIELLEKMGKSLQERSVSGAKPSVPHWLHKLIEFIDAIDNVSVISQRKNNMRAVTSDTWKWYDVSTGKWNAYSEANNQLIRNAYNAGERLVALNIGRQRYTISFNCMTQVSEASGSHRMVFPALKLSEAISNHHASSPSNPPRVDYILTRTLKARTEHHDELLCLRTLITFNDTSNPERTISGEENKDNSNSSTGGSDASSGSETQGIMTRSRTKSSRNAAKTIAKPVPPPPPPKRVLKIIISEEPVGLARYDCAAIISCLVGLLQTTNLISLETKLTILKLCARMTKEYENARVFLKKGGIKILLKLQQSCGLMGFPTYAIVIIRHILESPPVLQEAMERILSSRASGVVPVSHRDLIYLLTQVSSAVARHPKVFLAAAKNVLKGEYMITPAFYFDDQRMMVKAKYGGHSNQKSNNQQTSSFSKEDQHMVQTSIDVLKEVLLAIVQPCCHYGGLPTNENQFEPYVSAEVVAGQKPMAPNENLTTKPTTPQQQPQQQQQPPQSSSTSASSSGNQKKSPEKFEPCCCSWHLPSSGHTHLKPVLPRSTLLKVLADAVRSYQSLVPRVLMEHVYTPADSPLIEYEQTFMAFILDNFLAIVNRQQVPEISTTTKVLVSSLSDCYTQPAVQTKVVEEVHAAIARSLAQPDSAVKHTRLQVLMGLFPVMIESPMLFDKAHSHKNIMYRVLLRHGVMTYLTKIAQYKDLSNTNTLTTLSSILRPMEILLRLTLAPGSMAPKRILFAGGPHGAIINHRRLYPRLSSRGIERQHPTMAERSNQGDGENVLRDIIRNVLSDRRHAFEFILNSEDMMLDNGEVLNAAIAEREERRQIESASSSNNSNSNNRVATIDPPQINFDRLWDDFLQSEGLRLVTRGQNGANSTSNNAAAAAEHHTEANGANDNGVAGGSDGASISSDTVAANADNAASLLGEVSTSESDSESNVSTENDERNEEEDDDDANEDDVEDHSETDGDEEPRQFIEVFDHFLEPESSETASNDADVDVDDDDDDEEEEEDEDEMVNEVSIDIGIDIGSGGPSANSASTSSEGGTSGGSGLGVTNESHCETQNRAGVNTNDSEMLADTASQESSSVANVADADADPEPPAPFNMRLNSVLSQPLGIDVSSNALHSSGSRLAPEPWGPSELTFIAHDGSVTTFIPPSAPGMHGTRGENNQSGSRVGGGISANPSSVIDEHPPTAICSSGMRRRLIYLDQQYCVTMPTYASPYEESQLELFSQDALHWWLEEAKHLDLESPIDTCLSIAHSILPYLIKELKITHAQRKTEESNSTNSSSTTNNRTASNAPVTSHTTPFSRRSSIPVLIHQPNNTSSTANPLVQTSNSSSLTLTPTNTTTVTAGEIPTAENTAVSDSDINPAIVSAASNGPTSDSQNQDSHAVDDTSAQGQRTHRSRVQHNNVQYNICAEIDLTNDDNDDDDEDITEVVNVNDTNTAEVTDAAVAVAATTNETTNSQQSSSPDIEFVDMCENFPAESINIRTPRIYLNRVQTADRRENRATGNQGQGLLHQIRTLPNQRGDLFASPSVFNMIPPNVMTSAQNNINSNTEQRQMQEQIEHRLLEITMNPNDVAATIRDISRPGATSSRVSDPNGFVTITPAAAAAAAASVTTSTTMTTTTSVPPRSIEESAALIQLAMPPQLSSNAAETPAVVTAATLQQQQTTADSNLADIGFAFNPSTNVSSSQLPTLTTSNANNVSSDINNSTADPLPPIPTIPLSMSSLISATAGNIGTSSLVPISSATSHALASSAVVTDMSPEVRAALGDLEVPEGVDPSFLAALPSEMREEVIQEHLRMQRIRQRAQQNAIQIAHDSLVEVNPEFLAALPPNIQSEVLMQQRIEQQRQAAQTANPDDPVDTAAFFQNLPESLRQAILTDMEESQIASLPPDLAAEAQFLRRDWETRNGARIEAHPPQGNALSRFQSSMQGLDERWHAGSIWYDANGAPQTQNHHHTTIVHQHHAHPTGKPLALLMMEDENILLDPDSLATLLLFLFVEDTKINNLRLHRVIRNLCHHEPTRDWVINALINIIQKTNETNTNMQPNTGVKPQWLKLRVDAAFGYKSNIFIINKSTDGSPHSISVNPQAAQMIVRNCLDLLFVLAKHYPGSFVPYNRDAHKIQIKNNKLVGGFPFLPASMFNNDSSDGSTSGGSSSGNGGNSFNAFRSRIYRTQMNHQAFAQVCARLRHAERFHDPRYDDYPSTSKAAAASRSQQKSSGGATPKNKKNIVAAGSCANSGVSYNTNAKNFWDVILNIDTQTELRLEHVHTFPLKSQPEWEWETKITDFLSFNDSPFGQLLQMLPYKVICRSPHLTDMLVKLLASLSHELPKEDDSPETAQQQQAGGSTSSGEAAAAPDAAATTASNATSPRSSNTQGAVRTSNLRLPTVQLASALASQPVPADSNLDLPRPPILKKETSGDKPDAAATNATGGDDKQQQQQQEQAQQPNPKIKRKIYSKNFSQLQLVIEVLTHQCGTTDGLDNVSKLIVNLTQCSQASNAIFLQYLTAAILGLAEEVRQAIQTLLNEIRDYNSGGEIITPTSSTSLTSLNSSSSALPHSSTSVLCVSDGMMQDRFTAENVVISAPKNAKPSCELQLPSMKKLLSSSSAQPYFLRTLKIFMLVRDIFDVQNNANAGAGGDATSSANSNENANKPTLSQILCLDVLWNTLSECLAALEESKDEFAVLVLQPTVEAFFLIHASNKNSPKKPGRNSGGSGNSSTTSITNVVANNSTTATASASASASASVDTLNSSSTTNFLNTGSSSNPIQTNANSELLINNTPNDDSNTSTNSFMTAPPPSEESDETMLNSFTATEKVTVDSREAQLKRDRQKFLTFAEKHRTVLNQILRQSPTHLSDGPFAVLVDHTRILDFDVKRKYFQTELERQDEGIRREETTVSVRRVTVFEDSFRVLYRLGPEEWKNRFYIVFEDEEGQDAGGLLREWYVIISREIFNPMYALFCVSPGDRVTYMINPSSHANPNHLSYFKFVGRVIAKAIHDNKLLECYFTRSFYKHILGKQVKYTDMESQDYEFYKGLDYLMKNDISTLGYELTFSTEVQEFGVTQIRDLIPNGRDIAVTEENKFDYVQLVCQLKMSGSIRQQLDAFLEGFYDIIPKHLISIFNEQELELLISGLPDIDIEDLKANTEYHKYTSKSLQIQWFWRALRSFDQADRAKFLQFVTGTSKVPLQGFGSLEGMNGIQKFQIHRDDRSTDRLPCAHTCFNQLDLPMYKSYDKLRSCLLKAIHECSEGFGFA